MSSANIIKSKEPSTDHDAIAKGDEKAPKMRNRRRLINKITTKPLRNHLKTRMHKVLQTVRMQNTNKMNSIISIVKTNNTY
jgi:hypothetical protein